MAQKIVLRPSIEQRRDGSFVAVVTGHVEADNHDELPSGTSNVGVFGSQMIAEIWVRTQLADRFSKNAASIVEVRGQRYDVIDDAMKALLDAPRARARS